MPCIDATPISADDQPARFERDRFEADADALPAHPLERALALGRELRACFDLPAPEITWLLTRWRDRADVPLGNDALTLLARLVVADAAPAPITRAEAHGLAARAVQDLDALEAARGAVQRYLVVRGATAEQRARLDTLVRDLWHRQHGAAPAEVAHAA